MALSDRQKSFVELLKRSPDTGDGWRSVSPVLASMAAQQAEASPELFEYDSEGSRIRFTAEGAVVARYL